MGDLTLGDYGVILGTLIGVGVIGFIGLALSAIWPQPWRGIAQFFQALFQHFNAMRYAQPLSTVSVLSTDDEAADEQTDGQTDAGPSVLEAAIKAKRVDVIRGLIIDTLVSSGADVATVRSLLKGDNATIGAEVKAARERLGIALPPRTLDVRDSGEPVRKIAF